MALFRNKYFFLILAFLLGLSSYLWDSFSALTPAETAAYLSQKINSRAQHLKQEVQRLPEIDTKERESIYTQQEIGLYIVQESNLVYWNNSQIPLESFQSSNSSPLLWLRDGMYLVVYQKDGSQIKLALSKIKSRYDLQNRYLKNSFSDWLNLPPEVEISFNQSAGTPVFLDQKFLFSVKNTETSFRYPSRALWSLLLFYGALVSAFLFVVRIIKQNGLNLPGFLWIIALLFFRAGMLYFKFPEFLYETDLYNLRKFGNANSFLNGYLGDLVLNSSFLLALVVCVYYAAKKQAENNRKLFIIVIQIFLLVLCVRFHNHLFNTLSANSTISFDFINFFNLGPETYIALIPLVLVNLSVAISLYSIFCFPSPFFPIKVIILAAAIFIPPATWLLGQQPFFSIEWWWFPVYGSVAFILFYLGKGKNIPVSGILLFLAALFSSAILNLHVEKNRDKEFELFAYRLTERQDPVLENEFSNIPSRIEKDQQLKVLSQFISYNGDKEFLQLLRQNYFFGYFDRYNVEFALFDSKCMPLLSATSPAFMNEGYFEEQISTQGIPSDISGLYFIDKYKSNSRYIGLINISGNKLYVVLEPKYFEEVGTFPDLLMNESQQKQETFRNYSYAVYRENINNSMHGDYSYPLFLRDSLAQHHLQGAYDHHYYYPEDNTVIIISTKKKNWAYYFTYNSYMFLFFMIIAYSLYFLYQIFYSEAYKVSSLTRRIQTTVILLLLLSITAVGITSTQLVSNQFEKDNEKQLQEKTKTILSDLSGLLQNTEHLEDIPKELIDLSIKKFAYVFNSEVSLFNENGKLYLTSQPRLYDYGLAAKYVNPSAYHYLKNSISSSYCAKDMAGGMRYQSLYTPVYNNDKKLLAFLNLPYFGKQSVLTNELSGIISTLLNVYVILFIVSILSGLVLAGYITLPLRLLKQQLSKVSLGSKNAAIQWNSDDEIGKLVAEYNKMIEKLEVSAGLLAQSERETAWREMARQVAHEIKNPLTPMKLNLQYLQHVIKNNPKDFEERFTKASNTLIEQIDALANIATEFSNFAKLPVGEAQKVNLAEVLESAVALFEKDGAAKLFLNLYNKELYIMANREQLLRIFNNIITNALQAINEKQEEGKIIIRTHEQDGIIRVEVCDNGCGIPASLKEKIFTPNFTTKTTGSGLGLAMVKNMMDTMNAKIWFESEEGRGTSFYLEFTKL